ncbi:MAG: hypothetical protein HDS14_02335 [Bacteroides sp.]|nr:hypothetical protein [Bacteroides sp.]
MKSLKYLAFALCFCFSSQMWALDFQWFSFKLKDASEITVAADGLVMNYSDGNLLLTSGSVNKSLPVAEIASMRFVEASGVEGVTVSLYESATYYTLGGAEVGVFASADDAKRALPSGVYIAKSVSSSFKVIF